MQEPRRCPQCESDLATDAPEGLCPTCLFRQALENSGAEPGETPDSRSPAPVFHPPPPADLAKFFPQLEILEILGQGGMGAVYKARQTKLDRLIAVKILPPEVARDPAFAERFMREARSLARLNHPHIVTVYDFGETNGIFYFSMEFVDGKNARQLMQSGKLPQDQALDIVTQVCEALRYAHDEGIVHRDIKPENILLDKRGRVKIADFGLAKLVGLTPTYLTLTGAHEVMGTLYYMAPEQTRRSHLVDHRADVYSLGVVLYEMLTGELPLGRFAPPSHKAPIDERLDAIVLRALAREPENRYQDAADLKNEVAAIAAGAGSPLRQQAVPAPATWPSVRFDIPRSMRKGKKYTGAIYRDETELIVEFEEKGNFEDSEIKVVRIPLTAVASLDVKWNWEYGFPELVIHPVRLSALSGVPASKSGRGHFRIAWNDQRAAKKLMHSLRHRLPPWSGWSSDPQPPALAAVAPAIGLVLTSVSALTTNVLALIATGRNLVSGIPGWDRDVKLLCTLGVLMSLAVAVMMFVGGLRMLMFRSYPWAIGAAFLAMFPWTLVWPIGLAMGIWALVVLRRPAVMELFANNKGALREAGAGKQEPLDRPAGGGFASFFRSVRGYFVTTKPYAASGAVSSQNGPANAPDRAAGELS
jgi:serine/threonine protein kinase